MPVYTIHENFHIQLHGISGIAENKDWGATGMRLMNKKEVNLPKYVYYKHIGPYDKLQEAGLAVAAQLKQDGIKTGLPYLEIYGHWTEDPSKLETEMLWSIQP